MSGTEKFLEQNMRPVLQPMLRAVLADKPKDPVHLPISNRYKINGSKHRAKRARIASQGSKAL